MIMSSSLQKAALILVLNGVAGILPVTPILLGGRRLPTFTTLSVSLPLLISVPSVYLPPYILTIVKNCPPLASLSSDRHKSLAHANSAIFLVCFTLISLGYFIGIKKSILILSQIVPFLGFLVDSVRQSSLLIEQKKQNSFPFCVMFFTPTLLM